MKKIILIIVLVLVSTFSSEIKLLNQNARDFVYSLPLKKYPKFLCEATLINGKTVQFVSVKAMMEVYFHQKYFKDNKLIDASLKNMFIQDYGNGEKVNAKQAIYVFGSNIIGPHGNDLIPFKTMANAKKFEAKFGGTKIMPFKKISLRLLELLDM